MTETEVLNIFKALGDESRLRIVRMLMNGESYVELIASRLGITSATVSHHLKKLCEAGLTECRRTQFYMIYSLRPEAVSESIRGLIEGIPRDEDIDDKDAKYERQIIESFMPDGHLKTIPAQQKKREVVLRRIAAELDHDRADFTEREINEHILKYHEDYCTIRREMISLGIMRRENGVYTLV